MSDRPILFRDDMVRAILDGRKDVTRRVGPTWAKVQPGDRLWVREAHIFVEVDDWDGPRVQCTNLDQWPYPWRPHAGLHDVGVYYRADQGKYRPCFVGDESEDVRWRPSIHMPRWACRLELEVVSVEAESSTLVVGFLATGEAQREGFANRREFLAAWDAMHPDFQGTIYRIEFRRLARSEAA